MCDFISEYSVFVYVFLQLNASSGVHTFSRLNTIFVLPGKFVVKGVAAMRNSIANKTGAYFCGPFETLCSCWESSRAALALLPIRQRYVGQRFVGKRLPGQTSVYCSENLI